MPIFQNGPLMTEVLIVGGGLSGLALAHQLTKQGVDFLLVEAQDRLGGRILTKDLSGGKFDLGASWFWDGQPLMAELVRLFDIPVFEQYSTGDFMYQDKSGDVERRRGGASMQGAKRLSGGIGSLTDALIAKLDRSKLLTNTRLESVEYDHKRIIAKLTNNGKLFVIRAQKIVLAVPPRVISETISFEPVFNDTQSIALKNVPTWMVGQAKIVAVYDKPYWRNAGLSGDARSNSGPMVEIHDASPMEGGPYALFGFVGWQPDDRDRHKRELEQKALSQLVDLFGAKMAHPKCLALHDWTSIPEVSRHEDRLPARGHRHPSYGLHRSLSNLKEYGIYFSSTETSRRFGGFLEGALEAAERIATHIQTDTH